MYLVSASMAVVEISNQCGVEVCMHFCGACIVAFPSDCSLCGVPESVLISSFEFMQRNMHCEKVSICLVYQISFLSWSFHLLGGFFYWSCSWTIRWIVQFDVIFPILFLLSFVLAEKG